MTSMIGRYLRALSHYGVLALAAVLAMPHAGEVAAQQLEKVTISTSIETLDALLPQLGQREGIFKKHGLELTFVKGANGPAMVAAVVGGSADITHVSTALYFPAIQKGATFTFLSGNYDVDYIVIGQKKLAWPNASKGYPALVQDFKGKRIGVAGRGGATEFMVRKMLADAGLDPEKDVTFIAVGTGFGAAGAFQNDQVDVMVSIPPTDIFIGANNFVSLINIDMTHNKVYSPDYLFTVFAANSDFVAKRTAVAEGFCKGIKETMAFVGNPANRDKVLAFLISTMNLKPEQAAQVWDANKGNFNARFDRKRWDSMSKFSAFVPSWEKHVHEPCARIVSQ